MLYKADLCRIQLTVAYGERLGPAGFPRDLSPITGAWKKEFIQVWDRTVMKERRRGPDPVQRPSLIGIEIPFIRNFKVNMPYRFFISPWIPVDGIENRDDLSQTTLPPRPRW